MIFFRNFTLKIFALLFAIFLWVFVVSSNTPLKTFPSSGSLTPEIFNLPENLIVVGDLPNVTLKITADSKTIDTLSPRNFSVFVDLKGRSAGTHSVRLTATTDLPNVIIQRVEPDTADIVLETINSKIIPVRAILEGQPSANFSTEDPVLEFETVRVTGATSLIDQASEAVAHVKLSGEETKNVLKTWPLEVLDSSGNPLQLTPEKSSIAITVPLKQISSSKTVGVKVVLSGAEQNKNYYVSSITSDPLSVEIRGQTDLLNKITSLETKPVDVSTLTGNATRTVNFNLPTGITLSNTTPAVAIVLLEVKPYESTKDFTLTLTPPEDFPYTLSNNQITLTLSAPLATLSSLKPETIKLNLDYSTLSADVLTLTADNFLLPDSVNLASFTPSEITLTSLEENLSPEEN